MNVRKSNYPYAPHTSKRTSDETKNCRLIYTHEFQ